MSLDNDQKKTRTISVMTNRFVANQSNWLLESLSTEYFDPNLGMLYLDRFSKEESSGCDQ